LQLWPGQNSTSRHERAATTARSLPGARTTRERSVPSTNLTKYY
jgi:hypothetical protein